VTYDLGQQLLKKIQSHLTGEMKAYFVGSNAFKIPGISNDIDLLVAFKTVVERQQGEKILTTFFGNPVVKNQKFTKWECIQQGIPIEILLSHPRQRIFRRMFEAYTALSSDPKILAAYEHLKHNSVGVTVREYNRRQLFFFDYFVKHT
jgi:hypothetical protein